MTKRKSWTDFLATRSVQEPLLTDAPMPKRKKRPKHAAAYEPRETDIQRIILEALRLHPKVARIDRTNTGAGRFMGKDGRPGRFVRFGFPGQSDLTGTAKDGRKIAIEVKRPSRRNTATKEQIEYLDQVRAAGGYAGIACSVEEAFAIMDGGLMPDSDGV